MADVKIAQIGQTAVNRPFYEVISASGRFVFATDEFDRASFRGRDFLKSVGVSSLVANNYKDKLDSATAALLRLDANGMVERAKQFPVIAQLGTGLGFVNEFNPRTGWAQLYPTGALTFSL